MSVDSGFEGEGDRNFVRPGDWGWKIWRSVQELMGGQTIRCTYNVEGLAELEANSLLFFIRKGELQFP
jgi:hypothetical protein